MWTLRKLGLPLIAAVIAAGAGTTAGASPSIPVDGVTLPVARAEVMRGGGVLQGLARKRPTDKTIDGSRTDWGGQLPGFGGTIVRSRGELVYQDHIFDAYGADNGQDRDRLAVQDPLVAALPEAYRVEPALQYAPAEFGIPTGPFTFATNYGDLDHQDQADLSELRIGAAGKDALDVLARTTTMSDTAPATAVLLLFDTAPGNAERAIPFGSGLTSSKADVAVLLTAAGRGFIAELAGGEPRELPMGSVAADPSGYSNAIEARLPIAGEKVGVAAAAGLVDDAGTGLRAQALGPAVANVAFREREPARDWFDKQQALTLIERTIDPFFTDVDRGALRAGANQRFLPGPGYHDKIFESSATISREGGRNGILQHYGLFIPSSYRRGTPSPAQFWFHFRGGRAHIAAAVVPGIFEDMGEDVDSIVVTPDGRGSSGWYVGRSHADWLEVWEDVHKTVSIDRNRTYIAGHSMGGWASWLLPVLYPDRFAASFPASPPATQGLWTGVPPEFCDAFADEQACFQGANGGRARDQWVYPLLENLREVPMAIFQGAADELVWTTGVARMAERMRELGYRYRLYTFPGQEHYGPPIVDQWADGARYEHRFVRDPNPPRVTFTRSMPMERAVEEVYSDGIPLAFDFDKAYWMSGLEPVDPDRGIARFDGRTLAKPAAPPLALPDADGPAKPDQAGPYVMTGQQWLDNPLAQLPAARNAFEATLTGARAVTLSLRRMRLDATRAITGSVTTEAPLELTLEGRDLRKHEVTIDGKPADVQRSKTALVVTVPAGEHALAISPR